MKPSLIQMVRVPIKGRTEVMSLEQVQKLIADLTQVLRINSSDSHRIKLAVCAEFGIRLGELDSDQRTDRIVFPRQVGYWLHRTLTDMGLKEIGKCFPNRNGSARDHGTVHHGCQVVDKRMATDKAMRDRIIALQTLLTNPPPPENT